MSKRLTTNEFINKAKEVHGDRYNYSKIKYINANTKVCIICPEHGEFWQQAFIHTKGNGCPKCAGRNLTNNDIIKDFDLILTKYKDQIKNQFCFNNNIKLLRLGYTEFNIIEDILDFYI